MPFKDFVLKYSPMQDDNFKEDLFGRGGSFGKQPKLPVFDGYVRQQRYLPYVKIPTEYAVIALIAVLVMLTVSYALGVKVGRSYAPAPQFTTTESVTVTPDTAEKEVSEEEKEAEALEYQEIREMRLKSYLDYTEVAPEDTQEDIVESLPEEAVSPELEKTELPVPVAEPQALPADGKYVIYLAAFKEESRAKELADKLKAGGVDGRFAKKSDWYQVYAAGYKNITEANSAKAILKKSYADCYIRKIE